MTPKKDLSERDICTKFIQPALEPDEDKDAYRKFSPNFFDLIVIDECHRGSASEESAW